MKGMIVALFLFGATMASAQDRVTLANQTHSLSESELAILSDQANAGSKEAAVRLSDRYFYDLTKGQQRKMRAKALEWALIGAENGSAESQFQAYSLLSTSNERSKQIRALFWLKQSAANGYVNAQVQLKSCPSIEAKRRSGTPCFGPQSE